MTSAMTFRSRNHSRNFGCRNKHLFKACRQLAVKARRCYVRKLRLNYDSDSVAVATVLSSREQNNRGSSPNNNSPIHKFLVPGSDSRRLYIYASLYRVHYGDLMRNLIV